MKILKIVLIITNFATCSWEVDYDLPDEDFSSFQSKQEIRSNTLQNMDAFLEEEFNVFKIG